MLSFMDCIGALSQILMLGALLSTNRAHSLGIFIENQKSFIGAEGDYLRPGLQIIRLWPHRHVTFRCAGETLEYHFWASSLPYLEDDPVEDPLPPDAPLQPDEPLADY